MNRLLTPRVLSYPRHHQSWMWAAVAAIALAGVVDVDRAEAQYGQSWQRSWSSGTQWSYGNGGYQTRGWNNNRYSGNSYYTNPYGRTYYGGYVGGNNSGWNRGYSNYNGYYGGGYNNRTYRTYNGYYG